MNVYRFTWCVCSFDQECNILASTEEIAKAIFKEKIIGDNTTWAANHAYCYCLNGRYTQEHIDKNVKIHFSEV